MSKNLKYYLVYVFIYMGFTGIFAQNFPEKNITLKLKNTPVYQALNEITKQSGYYFSYEAGILEAHKIININFENTSLKTCLDRLFEDSTLIYQVYDNHIIIKKENKFLNDSIFSNPFLKTIRLQAKLVDAHTGKTLAYASVSLKSSNIGTISNENGIFVLKIPKNLIRDTLCISYIGYNNTCLPAIELYQNTKEIKLSKKYISIQEVLVRNRDPKSIIRHAVKKIAQNYSQKPVYLTSFYREKIKQKNKYMSLSEAVLKIYKTAYTSLKTDLIKIIKSRTFHNVEKQDSVQMKLKSGLKTALLLDIVKNIPDFINEAYFPIYKYYMSDIKNYNKHLTYVIAFEPKKDEKKALYRGLIYIDTKSLAIIGADYEISPERIHAINNRFIIKKEKALKVQLKKVNYQVKYQQWQGIYYLKYIKAILNLKVKIKKKWFATNFTTSLEMAVSNIDTTNVSRFGKKESIKTNTIFADEAHNYDEQFWNDFNFIKPEDDWQKAIKKLQLKLQKTQFTQKQN